MSHPSSSSSELARTSGRGSTLGDLGFEARDPYLGRVLGGRYRVTSFLGAGSMGRVYRATQQTLDRTVAVKILNASLCVDPAATQRFLREAQAASRFDHPNSVAVFDFGQEPDGTAYIVMEYLRGESLESLLEREGRLPAPRCVAIMSQVLAALSEAHDAGIVHRDVKPENIMLVPHSGEDGYSVKVTDFGIAKLLDESQSLKLTATGVTAGSPAYMSPEQGSAKSVDGRSDLYQCGVILFEMVTGRVPFSGDSAIALVMHHLKTPPPSPRSFNLLCPPALEALILQALEKEPEHRFATARAMRRALRAVAPDQVGATVPLARFSRPPPPIVPMRPSFAPTRTNSLRPAVADRPSAAPVRSRYGAAAAVAGAVAACALGMTLTLRAGDAAAGRSLPMVMVRARPVAAHATVAAPAAVPVAPAAPAIVFEARPEPAVARPAVAPTPRPVMAPVAARAVIAPATEVRLEPTIVAAAPPVAAPVVAAPAPVAVAPTPTPTLAGVDGSVVSFAVTGGITHGALQGQANEAANAVARCALRQAEQPGGALMSAPVTVQATVIVRDRRADDARLTGGFNGCREALLGAFSGSLPQGIDTDYEVRLTLSLAPRTR